MNKRYIFHIGWYLTCPVFVAVLGHLAGCYNNLEKFNEAEGLYRTQLLLLQEKPEENRRDIAAG